MESLTNKILDFLEKDRFSLTTALIYVFIIAGLRSLMEALVGSYYGYGKHLFFQHVILSYPQLLMGTLVIYLIIKTSPKKIMNVFLFGYGLLLLPPIVDYFIFRDVGVELGVRYDYLEVSEILPTLLHGWNPAFILNVGSGGQGVMFLSLMLGSAVYVALKINIIDTLKKFLGGRTSFQIILRKCGQVIGTYFGIFLLVWFIGSFTFFLNRKPDHFLILNYFRVPFYSRYYLFFMEHYEMVDVFPPVNSGILGLPDNLIINQTRLIFSSFFIILSIISTFIILRLSVPKKISEISKILPKGQTILLSLTAFVGMMSVHTIDPDFSKGFAIDPSYFLHLPYLFLCLIITILLFFFNQMVKQLSFYKVDEKSDGSLFNKYHYVQLSLSFALTALFFSYILGYIPLAITILWLLSAKIIYSESIYKNIRKIELAFFGILSFLIGFYSPDSWHSSIIYVGEAEVHFTREVVYRMPPITLPILSIFLWVILSLWFVSRLTIEYHELNQYILMGITALLLSFPLLYFNTLGAMLLFCSIVIATIIWYKILNTERIIWLGCGIQLFFFSLGFLLF